MTIRVVIASEAKQSRGLRIGLLLAVSFLIFGTAQGSDLQARLFASDNPGSNASLGLRTLPIAGLADRTSAGIPGEKPISRGGAMLRSLLIPGWGESYLGYHGTARAFFWADMALWASVIGLEVYSRWREDQFVSFAATHSGAQMEGKTDLFYANISDYMTTEEYNEAKLRSRNFDALYTDPAYFWAWDSQQNRQEYDHIRIQSRTAHNRIFFFIGAAALNRLISLIDSGKKATDMLQGKNQPAVGFHLEPTQDSQAISLVLTAQLAPK